MRLLGWWHVNAPCNRWELKESVTVLNETLPAKVNAVFLVSPFLIGAEIVARCIGG